MKKTAIIFPGVGYHTDKPLLYYGKKIAREFDYEIVEVPYKGFASGIKGDAKKMEEAFCFALQQTEEILKDVHPSKDDDILLISKSIGTTVSAAWQEKKGFCGKNIYFTPVEATFKYAQAASGIVFHGTADPWVKTEIVKKECQRLQLPLFITEDANHSMETGKTVKDIRILEGIMKEVKEYIRSGKDIR